MDQPPDCCSARQSGGVARVLTGGKRLKGPDNFLDADTVLTNIDAKNSSTK
jgi:hypothetical protein